jgi:hypothetical protein
VAATAAACVGDVMSVWVKERREDLMLNLYHANKLLAEFTLHDPNGLVDLQRRIRRATEEFHELGGTAEEFAAYCTKADAEVERQKQLNKERYYEQTGIIL